jgi:hypothetical protein
MTSASFSNVPDEPECDECARAYQIAQTTVRTCESFLNSFVQVRKDRNAQGTPTDTEQDLLRAMLVFACSGLDSMIKQLIKDALSKVIDQNEGAEVFFRSFIERKISKDQKLNFEVMALWPAPGSEDTELGVLMEPEVSHGETEVYAGVQA